MKRFLIAVLLILSFSFPVYGEEDSLHLSEIFMADDILQYARDLLGLDIPEDAEWRDWGKTEDTRVYRCEFVSTKWQQKIVLAVSVADDGWTSIQLMHRASLDGEAIPPSDAQNLDIKGKIARFGERFTQRVGYLPEIPEDTKILYESGLSLSNYFQDQGVDASEWRWVFALVLDGDGDWAYDDKVIQIYWDPVWDELVQVIVTPFGAVG